MEKQSDDSFKDIGNIISNLSDEELCELCRIVGIHDLAVMINPNKWRDVSNITFADEEEILSTCISFKKFSPFLNYLNGEIYHELNEIYEHAKNKEDSFTAALAEAAEREKKPPEASAPSRRPGMGVDD